MALAYERGDATIVANPATDMWALGMMAFELLTSETVFPQFTEKKDILDALCSGRPLPWEDGAEGRAERVTRLRKLKSVTLRCLSRLPEERPSAAEVVELWGRIYDSTKTDESASSGQPRHVCTGLRS